jgi:hypothetical protein
MHPMEEGWYDDPHARYTKRYFDGAGWSVHVMADSRQEVDPYGADQVTFPVAIGFNKSQMKQLPMEVAIPAMFYGEIFGDHPLVPVHSGGVVATFVADGVVFAGLGPLTRFPELAVPWTSISSVELTATGEASRRAHKANTLRRAGWIGVVASSKVPTFEVRLHIENRPIRLRVQDGRWSEAERCLRYLSSRFGSDFAIDSVKADVGPEPLVADESPDARLARLKRLHEDGLISDAQLDAQVRRVLDSL